MFFLHVFAWLIWFPDFLFAMNQQSADISTSKVNSSGSDGLERAKDVESVYSLQNCLSTSIARPKFMKIPYRVPPLMLSFRGSGEIFIRLLIEYATNVYTGSVDCDKTNEIRPEDNFPGQKTCNFSVSILHAHPSFVDLIPLKIWKNQQAQLMVSNAGAFLQLNAEKANPNCKNFRFQRMLIITRNLYESAWSQFSYSLPENTRGTLTTTTFNRKEWADFAVMN